MSAIRSAAGQAAAAGPRNSPGGGGGSGASLRSKGGLGTKLDQNKTQILRDMVTLKYGPSHPLTGAYILEVGCWPLGGQGPDDLYLYIRW